MGEERKVYGFGCKTQGKDRSEDWGIDGRTG
jgi:hypothetical protein